MAHSWFHTGAQCTQPSRTPGSQLKLLSRRQFQEMSFTGVPILFWKCIMSTFRHITFTFSSLHRSSRSRIHSFRCAVLCLRKSRNTDEITYHHKKTIAILFSLGFCEYPKDRVHQLIRDAQHLLSIAPIRSRLI